MRDQVLAPGGDGLKVLQRGEPVVPWHKKGTSGRCEGTPDHFAHHIVLDFRAVALGPSAVHTTGKAGQPIECQRYQVAPCSGRAH